MVNTVYPEFQKEKLSWRTYLGLKTSKKWALFEFSRDPCGTDWGCRRKDKGMHPKHTKQGENPLIRVIWRLSICLFSKFLQEVSFYRQPKMSFLSTDFSTQFTPTRIYIYIYINIHIFIYKCKCKYDNS